MTTVTDDDDDDDDDENDDDDDDNKDVGCDGDDYRYEEMEKIDVGP